MADVVEVLNETAVDGNVSGEPVAFVLGASYKWDGWRGDGWSLGRGVAVRTGEAVGEAEVNGISAALAGQAWTDGSGRPAASVALDMLVAPHRLDPPRKSFARDKL